MYTFELFCLELAFFEQCSIINGDNWKVKLSDTANVLGQFVHKCCHFFYRMIWGFEFGKNLAYGTRKADGCAEAEHLAPKGNSSPVRSGEGENLPSGICPQV